jgi:hypothetical protein
MNRLATWLCILQAIIIASLLSPSLQAQTGSNVPASGSNTSSSGPGFAAENTAQNITSPGFSPQPISSGANNTTNTGQSFSPTPTAMNNQGQTGVTGKALPAPTTNGTTNGNRLVLQGKISANGGNVIPYPNFNQYGIVTSGPLSNVLTGQYGETTSLVPFGMNPAFLGFPGYGGGLGYANNMPTQQAPSQYTPSYKSYMQSRMFNRSIYSPMSVIHTGAESVQPTALMIQDTLTEGIPTRVSGAVIMEYPGSEYVALNNGAERRQLAYNKPSSRMVTRSYAATYTATKRHKVIRAKRTYRASRDAGS